VDHTVIEAEQVVDRYLMGDLPAAEREAFEHHFMECESCQDALEMTDTMMASLRQHADLIQKPSFGQWFRAGLGLWQPWVAAAAVLVMGLGLAFGLQDNAPAPSLMQSVVLDSTRAGDELVIRFAPDEAGKQIQFDLPEPGENRVSLHDESGAILWEVTTDSSRAALILQREWVTQSAYTLVVSQRNVANLWDIQRTYPFRVEFDDD